MTTNEYSPKIPFEFIDETEARIKELQARTLNALLGKSGTIKEKLELSSDVDFAMWSLSTDLKGDVELAGNHQGRRAAMLAVLDDYRQAPQFYDALGLTRSLHPLPYAGKLYEESLAERAVE